MENLIFILKPIGFVVLIALIVGILAGFVTKIFKQEHPHIVFPIYMITGVLSGIAGFVISLIVSIIYVIISTHDIFSLCIICGILIIIVNIALIIRIITR
jgi:hypothetical protein